jgi:hypothetical protein
VYEAADPEENRSPSRQALFSLIDSPDIDKRLAMKYKTSEHSIKDPTDVIADYLTFLRQHTWGVLDRICGVKMLHALRKELVVTLPANWSGNEAEILLQVVRKAKFDVPKISTVSER